MSLVWRAVLAPITLPNVALPERAALIVRAVDRQLLQKLLSGGIRLVGVGHLLKPLGLTHRERVKSVPVPDTRERVRCSVVRPFLVLEGEL